MYRKIVIIIILLHCYMLAMGSPGFAWGTAPKPTADDYPEAINFTLEDLNGTEHTLSDYNGRIVFLNFWATWCPPCRAEMPSMQKLYETWDKNMYVMLAVNVGEDRAQVKAFMDRNKYTFPVLLDKDRKVSAAYQIQGIPTTFLVDENGRIKQKEVGARDWDLEWLKI